MRFFVSCVIAAVWQMVGMWGWTFLIASVIARSTFPVTRAAPLGLLSYFWDVRWSHACRNAALCTRPLSIRANLPLCVSSYTYCVRARLQPHTNTVPSYLSAFLANSLFARATEHDSMRDAPIRFSSRSLLKLFVCLLAAHHENFLCAFYFGLSVLEDLTSKAKNLRQCRANDQIARGNSPPVRHIA